MLKEERIENTLKAEQTRQHVKSGTDLFLAEKGGCISTRTGGICTEMNGKRMGFSAGCEAVQYLRYINVLLPSRFRIRSISQNRNIYLLKRYIIELQYSGQLT
jgi:hypothetical protein